MPTIAPSPAMPGAGLAPTPGPAEGAAFSWRALALLGLAVLLLHLLLLGLIPARIGTDRSALDNSFITRTIVIAAPPSAPPPGAAGAPPESAPKPARPHPAARPRPAPVAQPVETDPADASATAPASEAAADASVAASAPSSDAAASGDGSANAKGNGNGSGGGSGGGSGTGTGSGSATGDLAGSSPLQIPGSVRLAFAATAQRGAQPLSGVFGELVWLQDGSRYDARLSWTVLWKTVRSERSSGTIGPTGIEPLLYSDSRRAGIASHLLRDQKLITFDNGSPSLPLLAGAQDRLSVVLQIGSLIGGDPARYPAGAVLAIQTVGPKDAEIWTFTVDGDEDLSVPAGQFIVRKLTRNPRAPGDDKVEIWLAPRLGWLPVRMKLTQPSGDFIDLQVRNQAELAAPAPPPAASNPEPAQPGAAPAGQ